MVKPALPYLDVLAKARAEFDCPLAAYHVSGEYAMIHAAAERGWLEGPRALEEALTSIKRVERALTDRGSEFKGGFDAACRRLGIWHTRTKPRHAFTNGFVERLRGTVLHEHWRVEFRQRYFTRLRQLERSLQSYLRLYNHDRPHRGYRTRGRTPAEMVRGTAHAKA